MAYIRERVNKNGDISYRAEIILKDKGNIYFRKAKSFDALDLAEKWAESFKPLFNEKINYFENPKQALLIGYENNYLIFSNGAIYSKLTKRFLKPEISDSGYLRVQLSNGDQREKVLLHRLVAQHFIDNPSNKPEVNHCDGNKRNCDASNLEWHTSSENNGHAERKKLKIRCNNCGCFVNA